MVSFLIFVQVKLEGDICSFGRVVFFFGLGLVFKCYQVTRVYTNTNFVRRVSYLVKRVSIHGVSFQRNCNFVGGTITRLRLVVVFVVHLCTRGRSMDVLREKLFGFGQLRTTLRDDIFFSVFSMFIGNYYTSGLGFTS